jgi:hypothetical protein
MTRGTRLAIGSALCLALGAAQACFREAPPCDQASYDALADTCEPDGLTVAQCAERLRERTAVCTKRIRAE